jgi:CHAD domain-containing protein
VRRWISGHPRIEGLSLEPRSPLQLRDTYLDTQDFRVFRAGFALRVRTSAATHEATLKALASARTDVADRVELSEPLPGGRRESLARLLGPVGTRVHAVVGRRPLRPLFEVRTRRERFSVRENGTPLGEITLDETVICEPAGGERARTERVEVEAHGTHLEPLSKLVTALTTDCGLGQAPVSKFELGMRSMALDPRPPAVAPPEVHGTMGTGEAALLTLRPLLSSWNAAEPGARLGDDPAQLHALRVTTRRMDAILGMFAPYLPRSLSGVRPSLKALMRILGEVRDHDLQLQTLATFAGELERTERAALEPLQQQLQASRDRARKRMLNALDAPGTTDGLQRLATAVGSSRTPRAAAALSSVAPALIVGHFRKLRKAFRKLGENPSMESYHRARRRAKRLRYALEPVAEVYGGPAQQMLRSLRRLQERLGMQQDAHVARTRLTTLAAEPHEDYVPLTLFLMGRLAERQAPPDESARERIDKIWRKLCGPRWKALKERMEALEEPADSEGQPALRA